MEERPPFPAPREPWRSRGSGSLGSLERAARRSPSADSATARSRPRWRDPSCLVLAMLRHPVDPVKAATCSTCASRTKARQARPHRPPRLPTLLVGPAGPPAARRVRRRACGRCGASPAAGTRTTRPPSGTAGGVPALVRLLRAARTAKSASSSGSERPAPPPAPVCPHDSSRTSLPGPPGKGEPCGWVQVGLTTTSWPESTVPAAWVAGKGRHLLAPAVSQPQSLRRLPYARVPTASHHGWCGAELSEEGLPERPLWGGRVDLRSAQGLMVPLSTLWNLSSSSLKMVIIDHGLQTLTHGSFVPTRSWEPKTQ